LYGSTTLLVLAELVEDIRELVELALLLVLQQSQTSSPSACTCLLLLLLLLAAAASLLLLLLPGRRRAFHNAAKLMHGNGTSRSRHMHSRMGVAAAWEISGSINTTAMKIIAPCKSSNRATPAAGYNLLSHGVQ
jgi:hypothetical protein